MKKQEEIINDMKEFIIKLDEILKRITKEHIEEFNSNFISGKTVVRFDCALLHEEPIVHLNYYVPVIKIHCQLPYSEWEYHAGMLEYCWVFSKLTEDEKKWFSENFKTFGLMSSVGSYLPYCSGEII